MAKTQPCVCHISLGSEGNVLYPVLSSWQLISAVIIKLICWLFGGFLVQMILAEKAEALREEADSLSTVPADN